MDSTKPESIEDSFDTTIFNDIVAAQEARCQVELADEYQLFNERVKFLDDGLDDDHILARDVCSPSLPARP